MNNSEFSSFGAVASLSTNWFLQAFRAGESMAWTALVPVGRAEKKLEKLEKLGITSFPSFSSFGAIASLSKNWFYCFFQLVQLFGTPMAWTARVPVDRAEKKL